VSETPGERSVGLWPCPGGGELLSGFPGRTEFGRLLDPMPCRQCGLRGRQLVHTRIGWTLGGGAEFLLARNVTFKAEYLYINLGDDGVTAVATTPTAGFMAASFKSSFGDGDVHTVRLGLNYKFGG
jgi:hypothetical protein